METKFQLRISWLNFCSFPAHAKSLESKKRIYLKRLNPEKLEWFLEKLGPFRLMIC